MRLLLVAFIILVVISCSSPKATEEKTVDSTTITTPPIANTTPATNTTPTSSNIEELYTRIFGTEKGLIRGVNFGDAISTIKSKEKEELFEEVDTHVGYSFDTENIETVDILYDKDKQNKLIGIELDIYLNTDASTQALKNKIVKDFNARFGASTTQNDLITWQLKPSGNVTLKTVSGKLDKGLEVRFKQ